jgi:hypothetical protein
MDGIISTTNVVVHEILVSTTHGCGTQKGKDV